jgi:hypothetical protein
LYSTSYRPAREYDRLKASLLYICMHLNFYSHFRPCITLVNPFIYLPFFRLWLWVSVSRHFRAFQTLHYLTYFPFQTVDVSFYIFMYCLNVMHSWRRDDAFFSRHRIAGYILPPPTPPALYSSLASWL